MRYLNEDPKIPYAPRSSGAPDYGASITNMWNSPRLLPMSGGVDPIGGSRFGTSEPIRPLLPGDAMTRNSVTRGMRSLNGKVPGPGVFSKDNLAKLTKGAEDLKPFVSNIMNAFRKPPMPKRGTPNSYITLPEVSLQNERNQVEAATTTANRSAERSVDANTAEAVKAFNRGTGFSQLSSINQRENNENREIRGRQAIANASIEAGNNDKIDEYNQQLVERDIAHQREQSFNVANAGDKLMGIRNQKEMGRVELEKARVLKSIYSKSGVLDRQQKLWDEEDLDPFQTKKKAYGGEIEGPGPKYRFSTLTKPTSVDSILYRQAYSDYSAGDPLRQNSFAKLQQFGINPELDPAVVANATNEFNAYEDARTDMRSKYINAKPNARGKAISKMRKLVP